MVGAQRGLVEQLALLLDALRASRSPVFSINVRDEIDAHRLAFALIGRGRPTVSLSSLAAYFAPLLVRGREEQAAFEAIVARIGLTADAAPTDGAATGEGGSAPPCKTESEEGASAPWWGQLFRRWRIAQPSRRALAALLLVALFALAIPAVLFWQPGSRQAAPTAAVAAGSVAARPASAATQESAVPQELSTDVRIINRLVDAARGYDDAPTLRELSRELANGTGFSIGTDEYLRRLQSLTGLPADRPLAAFGDGGPAAQGDTPYGTIQQIAWAIVQIETPGARLRLGDIAEPLMSTADYESRTRVVRQLRALLPRLPGGASSVAAVVSRVRALWPGGAAAGPLTWDDDRIARTVAVLRPDWSPPDAPWQATPRDRPAMPAWSGWLAAAIALAVMAVALLPLLDPRRAFLRRRPPLSRPHRMALVREAAATVLGAAETFRAAHRALQRREARAGRTTDLRGTIRATIRSGGVIALRSTVLQTRPDYLVLIEQRGSADLEAQRAVQMLAPLRTGAIGVEIYFFEGDPALLRAERDGRAATIQELIARYPNHRLMLVSDGATMLDLFNGKLRGGFAHLGHWRRRGMLTSVPRAQWAREETLIARGLGGPVTQLTDSGILALARRLPEEARPGAQLLDSIDDGTPMPRPLSLALARTRSPAGLEDEAALDALVNDLSWYPDGPGFEWLCALAVYPAVTFDLALYLGTRLPFQVSQPDGPALFTPARLAGLTRIEWLRAGRIPDPIRRRLVARLSPERARQVRTLLKRLIDDADAAADAPPTGRASFGRDTPDGPPPDRLYEDEVLVDFMRRGEVDELEVAIPAAPPPTWRERLGQIDWLQAGAAVVVLGYALAAWFVTPGAAETPADPIAWLAMAAVAVCALLSVVLLRPVTVWLRLRSAAWQFATAGIVVAVLAAATLAKVLLLPSLPVLQDVTPRPAITLILAVLMWPPAWWVLGRLARDAWYPEFRADAVARLAGQAVIGGSLSLAIVGAAGSLGRATPFALAFLIATGASIAALYARRATRPPVKVQADLTRLRLARPLARGAPFAAGLVLLAGCLWLAREGTASRRVWAGPPSAERLVATSPDGLVAVTEGDGRTIAVFAARDPATVLKRVTVAPIDLLLGGPKGLPSSSEQWAKGRVTGLVVRRLSGTGNPIVLVVTTADGSVLAFDGEGRQSSVATRHPSIDPFGANALAPPVIAVNDRGTAFAARTFDDGGLEISVVGADGAAFIAVRSNSARATAVAPVGTGCFLWTQADGALGAIRADPADGGRSQLGPRPGARYERLAVGARLIRPLSSSGRDARFLLIADDGTAARVAIDCDRGFASQRVGRIEAMALGAMPAWREPAQPIPAAVAPPPVDAKQPTKTPVPGIRVVRLSKGGPPSKVAGGSRQSTVQGDKGDVPAVEPSPAPAADDTVISLPPKTADLAVRDGQLWCASCATLPSLRRGLGRAAITAQTSIVLHDTNGSPKGDAPSLTLVSRGRPDLPGPLAHVLIGRDGTVYQVARFDERTSHVGMARAWGGVAVGNSVSIGVELEHVTEEPYPAAQLTAAQMVVRTLMEAYKIGTIVGHKEVAVPAGRKIDPALDMREFRSLLGLPAEERYSKQMAN